VSPRPVRTPRFSILLGLTLAAVAGPPSLPAVEISATGISLPFFDATGKLSHRLVAKHGTKQGSVQILRELEVRYFSAEDPNVVVQTLTTVEAEWDDRKGTLTGPGRIAVSTAENQLTGEGFDFALATSLLHIHRLFTMKNPEVLLTSDRATVEVVVERAGENLKLRDVKRCEASGNLVITVQPTAVKAYGFEKAYSEKALYDGATRTIFFPEPTRTQGKDVNATLQTMTLRLGAAPAKANETR